MTAPAPASCWAWSPAVDYRVSRMDPDAKVADFMTPVEKLIYAPEGTQP